MDAQASQPERIELSSAQRRELSARGHALKPAMKLAAGAITEAQLAHLRKLLEHHDLLKITVDATTREERGAQVRAIALAAGCVLVQEIGHVALLHRPLAQRDDADDAAESEEPPTVRRRRG